jgi:hypothetical protein
MPQRLTINRFHGGLNTNIDKALIDPVFYTDAHNVELVTNGKFRSLTNVKGTQKFSDITSVTGTAVLGAFPTTYLISGEKRSCFTVFTAKETITATPTFNIWCFDIANDVVYALFQEVIKGPLETNPYITADRAVDAVAYAENGVDHIYFVDGYNEPRFFRCEIPSPYSANFFTAGEIALQRRGANGKITLDSILSGGSLLSGSYQFAYRLLDPVNKRFTKWSSLTLPIHVYSSANSTTEAVYSDIGLPTAFKIRVDITPTTLELAMYDYFQLAVINNVYPTGPEVVTNGDSQTFVASLLPIESISTYLSGGVIANYDYKTNSKVGVVPIEELVVPHAPIKSAKTLSVKQNRLVLGNIKYHDFALDNGTPVVGGGSILTRTSSVADMFSSHEESIYRGFFRDETYRYGVRFFDTAGNRGPVSTLDLSSITNNQISGGQPDVRFPSRSTGNSWALFDTNSPARIKSLGLQLTNLTNIPSWAAGCEIVVAKRIKKILTQTPVVPMTFVQGTGALDAYPSSAVTVASGAADNEYDDAQPQKTTKIYTPKNLFWPEIRTIKRTGVETGVATTKTKIGEAQLVRSVEAEDIPVCMVFPQSYMYADEPFVLKGGERLDVVDYCALRADIDDISGGTAGDKLDTRITGTFYALGSGDYYFDPAWAAKTINESQQFITASKSFQNLDTGASVSGFSVMDYESLTTEGVDYGFTPTIQKCVILNAKGNHNILGRSTLTFASAGQMNPTGSGVAVFSSGTLVYENSSLVSNAYVNEYANYSNKSTFIQALKIVNIVNDHGDDRYGPIDTQHEFISTGAIYSFSTLELAALAAGTPVTISSLDVWGGDCFISPHTFKVTDGAYSVVNQSKANTPAVADSFANLITKWGKYFLNTSGAAISLPVGISGAAQFITVVLESEYNGGVMAKDILDDGTGVNNMAIMTINYEELIHSPLTYRHNTNLSKQNDQAIFLPRPTYNFEQDEFPSRYIWSDQKVYNTDEVGFDIFRVLNFRDLEEKYGSLTKLAVESDNLYAIQQKGITALPAGETQLATTDAGTLSVGTSDFIGRHIVISTNAGCQHLRTVVEQGSRIYFPDWDGKNVYQLSNLQLSSIAYNNESLFRTWFITSATTDERDFFAFYDSTKKQMWLADYTYCYIFSEPTETIPTPQWVSNLEFGSKLKGGGVGGFRSLYLVGNVSNVISMYRMYIASTTTLMGTDVTPRVTFVVNPDSAVTKTFDNQMYTASERLNTADFLVEREVELSDQSVSGTNIAITPPGGNYRFKLPRGANSERLRGQYLITTFKWKTTNISSLSEVFTKYRLQSRVPY